MQNSTIMTIIAGLVYFIQAVVFPFAREAEYDKYGNATMRYLGLFYGTMLIGCLCLVIGIYQWSESLKPNDTDDARIFAYILFTFAIASCLASIGMFKLRITLKDNEIIYSRWLFDDVTYKLSECTNIEKQKNKIVLEFNNNRTIKAYPLYSGYKIFMEMVHARVPSSIH